MKEEMTLFRYNVISSIFYGLIVNKPTIICIFADWNIIF